MAQRSTRSEWCVYYMRMARVNIYLPDELAEEARRSDLNVSSLAQQAIRSELAARDLEAWLQEVGGLEPTGVTHAEVIEAVAAAKDELEGA